MSTKLLKELITKLQGIEALDCYDFLVIKNTFTKEFLATIAYAVVKELPNERGLFLFSAKGRLLNVVILPSQEEKEIMAIRRANGLKIIL